MCCIQDKEYKAKMPNPSENYKITLAEAKKKPPLRQLLPQTSGPLIKMNMEIFVHTF